MPSHPFRPSETAGERTDRTIEGRAARADRAKFYEVMARVGREAPRDGDEIPE